MKKNIQTLAALLMAVAGTTACSSEDDIAVDTLPQKPAEQTYTMTVEASKGDDVTTRALSLDGTALNATWDTTEKVYVYSPGKTFTLYGTLSPMTGGSSTTTLTGTMTAMPGKNEQLLLFFPRRTITFTGQVGTLADIAENFDYGEASVFVTDVDETRKTITTSSASFGNLQAIVKFTLLNSSGNAISASSLTISDSENKLVQSSDLEALSETNGDITVTPASATSEIYVALSGVSSSNLTLTATEGDRLYTYTKSGVTFSNGKYYDVKVKMVRTYKMVAKATAEDVGKVVCAVGHLHNAKTVVPYVCTAVGVLGRVTATGHGLILALQDASRQTWNTINSWTSVTDYAGTTLKLLPDDAARGSLKSYTTLGETTVSNWCVAQKSDYEAIFTNLGSTRYDEDGTTYDDNVNAYITTGVGGAKIYDDYWSATMLYKGYAWDFGSRFWDEGETDMECNLRPVLAF